MKIVENSANRDLGEVILEPAVSPPILVKKQSNQYSRWCFTLNNYTLDEISAIVLVLGKLCRQYIFQEEIGKNGTPHLQGCFWLKVRLRLTAVKVKINDRAHYEACKSWDDSVVYCQKEDTREGKIYRFGIKDPPVAIKVISEDQFYDWEKDIIQIITSEADDRTIYWFWESIGKTGKSTFCKYLAVRHGALVLAGKAADMKYGIIKYIENNVDYPKLLVFDVPRTVKDYLSYTGIEEVKNALFFSSKYESGMVVGNCPHLLVFANFEPEYNRLSADRWVIKHIGDRSALDSSDEE